MLLMEFPNLETAAGGVDGSLPAVSSPQVAVRGRQQVQSRGAPHAAKQPERSLFDPRIGDQRRFVSWEIQVNDKTPLTPLFLGQTATRYPS